MSKFMGAAIALGAIALLVFLWGRMLSESMVWFLVAIGACAVFSFIAAGYEAGRRRRRSR